MAVEVDITRWALARQDEYRADRDAALQLGAAIEAWLNERGHTTGVTLLDNIYDEYRVTVEFEDPELAMLFKLTWL